MSTEERLFWYEMYMRPMGPGCQPKGLVKFKEDVGRWGLVAYDRELTEEELYEYELKVWEGKV